MAAAILTKWSFDPSIVGGLALLTLLYWRFARGRDGLFALMLVLAFLALESPLDFLADNYLFSVHMVQHMLLILGVAPLLALALPASLKLPALLSNPVLAFVAFTADFSLWHVPVLYE